MPLEQLLINHNRKILIPLLLFYYSPNKMFLKIAPKPMPLGNWLTFPLYKYCLFINLNVYYVKITLQCGSENCFQILNNFSSIFYLFKNNFIIK